MEWNVSNKMVIHPERDVEIEDILVNYNESQKTLTVVAKQEQDVLYDLILEIGIDYYYKPTEIKTLVLSEREKKSRSRSRVTSKTSPWILPEKS